MLAKVELGEADAGFVYITDALSAGDKVKQITFPVCRGDRRVSDRDRVEQQADRGSPTVDRPRNGNGGPEGASRSRLRASAFHVATAVALVVAAAFFLLPLIGILRQGDLGAGPELAVSPGRRFSISLELSAVSLLAMIAGGDAGRLLDGDARVPREGHALDRVRAAARAAAGRGRARPLRSVRPHRHAGLRARRARDPAPVHAGGGRDGDDVRRRAALPASGRGRLLGRRPRSARSSANARSGPGQGLRARRGAARIGRPRRGRGAGMGSSAGRVRGHDHVRGQPPGRHPDGARSRSTWASSAGASTTCTVSAPC